MPTPSEQLDEKMRQLAAWSRERGVPVTTQRRLVMEALASRRDHPTAEDLYRTVHAALPALSRTTVYRVLDAFVAMGLVRRISSREARARFDADTGQHHHIQCIACGAVTDCRDGALDALPPPAAIPAGYRILDYSVSFTGVCPACAARGGTPGQPGGD